MIGLVVAMLAWFCGSVFGSLSVASSERGASEEEEEEGAARFNARLMLFFYALAFLVVIGSGLLTPTR